MDEKKLAYHREYNIRRYHRIFAELIEEMGGKCAKCGSGSELHFDHIDRSSKSFDISTGITSRKMLIVREEMKKCQLLCRTCHSSKTTIDTGKQPMGRHGTITLYVNGKCRCEECRSAMSVYNKEYRRKRALLA